MNPSFASHCAGKLHVSASDVLYRQQSANNATTTFIFVYSRSPIEITIDNYALHFKVLYFISSSRDVYRLSCDMVMDKFRNYSNVPISSRWCKPPIANIFMAFVPPDLATATRGPSRLYIANLSDGDQINAKLYEAAADNQDKVLILQGQKCLY